MEKFKHCLTAGYKWQNSIVQCNNVSIIFLSIDAKSEEIKVKEKEAISPEKQKNDEVSTTEKHKKPFLN